jgi:hypothetical protein
MKSWWRQTVRLYIAYEISKENDEIEELTKLLFFLVAGSKERGLRNKKEEI